MAANYYDDALAAKLKKWIPSTSKLRVLKPDETKRLFETMADDSKDAPVQLPVIALSRSKDIELLLNIKNPQSFDGLRLAVATDSSGTALLNRIPIKLTYQMDIYTKTFEQGDEYVRNFLFKLINNPRIVIDIPYNKNKVLGMDLLSISNASKSSVQDDYYRHVANIRVLSTVSDTSDITEHMFPGQFTRWTIHLEIQDASLFSIPYRTNWVIEETDLDYGFIEDDEDTVELASKPLNDE